MKRTLTVTDLTRMYGGYVCVAGQAADGEWIRLHAPRVTEFDVSHGRQAIVYPSAIVECDLLRHAPRPPHTEDYGYNPETIRSVGRQPQPAWRALLERSCFANVAAIFEQPIHDDHGRYLADGDGPRSLGTIQPAAIHEVRYAADTNQSWDYRLGFYDAADTYYRLKITDFTWHRYCDSLRGPDSEPPAVARRLTQQLKTLRKTDGVFLRLGLSRGWKAHPDRCYLQLNGLYTFPDYLAGRTFADL